MPLRIPILRPLNSDVPPVPEPVIASTAGQEATWAANQSSNMTAYLPALRELRAQVLYGERNEHGLDRNRLEFVKWLIANHRITDDA